MRSSSRAYRVAAVAAVAIAGCADAAEPAPVPWLYAAPRPPWPQPPARTQIGGGDVPIALVGEGLVAGAGVAGGPLVMRTLIGASDGRAEAALSGFDGAGPAIELIDVDDGVVRWRNRTAGQPAVAIRGALVYAAGGDDVVALDRASGAERARYRARWIHALGDGVAVAVGERVALIDERGLGPARAVPGVVGDVAAVCGGGLVAWRGGRLERWDDDGAAFVVTWATPAPQPLHIDCAPPSLIISGGAPREVRAFDAADGKLVGTVIAADFWPARDGDGVELATAAGIERRDRWLKDPAPREPVAIDHLLASRGGRRLVLGADGGPVLLDGGGARALAAPAGDPMVVAGDRGFVTGPWRWPLVTQHPQPARFAWPADHLTAAPGVAPPPPLLGDPPRADLPAPQSLTTGIAAEAGAWSVGQLGFAPDDPERLYAIVLEDRPTADRGAGVAAFDLHAERWRWVAAAGCPPGQPVALESTAAMVVCGARGVVDGAGAVRALRAIDGGIAWEWRGTTVDAVAAAGDAVAIIAGAEAVIVDAATGAERGRWRTSDGFLPRLAVVRGGGDTRIASLEHGAIVTRSFALGLLPIDAVAVGGRVTALAALGDTVAAGLGDGSLYLLDADGRGRAAGALAPAWAARGTLAIALGTNPLGDAVVIGVDADGVPRLGVALAGVEIAALGVRSAAPTAPLALAATDGRALVVDLDGRVRAIAAAPAGAKLFATVVDGAPVAGVVVAKPLRVVRVELR